MCKKSVMFEPGIWVVIFLTVAVAEGGLSAAAGGEEGGTGKIWQDRYVQIWILKFSRNDKDLAKENTLILAQKVRQKVSHIQE